MKDFNPDNEKHMEIVQETEQAIKEEAEKQVEKEYPRLENGQVDFMTIISQMFEGQIGVVNYVQGICKGYALDMSLKTANNLMSELDNGKTKLTMDDIIPEEIKPSHEKVTQNDIK
jgi:ornithine cyclodeaminase/alanine dehydrogenase-like protein (mu-crystallin family)|tara:strand:+ start:1241 stop:1588 length:348 start_codon:yes stop_codon:yes gene_type:complete